jgi:ell wall binding domain 2 (CWB2)
MSQSVTWLESFSLVFAVFSSRPTSLALLCALALAGCGGGGDAPQDSAPKDTRGPALGQKAEEPEAARGLGFPDFATKNTTRVGGADAVASAAGTALAVYPSRNRETRPAAVVLVDGQDWRAAISAAQLMSRPLRAPMLFTEGQEIPAATEEALGRLNPTGASQAGRAQVIRVGAAPEPDGWRVTDVEGDSHAALAAAIDKIQRAAAGRASGPGRVIVAPAGAPEYAMPAAAWAAKSGDPVLWADENRLPAATREAISARGRPDIYVLGPESAISEAVFKRLQNLGETKRIEGSDPVQNAIEFARYSDGRFGWNVVDPGHGLVFASAKRPLDAAAAAPLSASGSYGPLLLVAEAAALPGTLQGYLLDIQPGYDRDPVRAVYNHGWLIGDEQALSVDVQARIDALLEVQPIQAAPAG